MIGGDGTAFDAAVPVAEPVGWGTSTLAMRQLAMEQAIRSSSPGMPVTFYTARAQQIAQAVAR